MNLVVDASVAVKWFVPEDSSEAAGRLLTGGHTLSAPDLVLVEAAVTFWKKVGLGEMDQGDADDALTALCAGTIKLQPTSSLIRRALVVARDIGHSVYDCVYLVAAEEMRAVVVTADRRFLKTAKSTAWKDTIVDLGRLPDAR